MGSEEMKEQNGIPTLAEQISDRILDYIVKKDLKPGDRIGTEMELVENTGVSRSTVREAIKILVSRNILEVRHGSGTYVSEQKGVVEDPLGLNLIHDKFKLTWDLLEFRMMIEPQIAYLAASNISQKQIEELEYLCDRAETLAEEHKDRLKEDVRFHICVAEASGNLVAPNLIPIIQMAVELFVHYTGREKAPETVARHRDILEGLKRHDPEWARDMMNMHLTFNRQELRRVSMEREKKIN